MSYAIIVFSLIGTKCIYLSSCWLATLLKSVCVLRCMLHVAGIICFSYDVCLAPRGVSDYGNDLRWMHVIFMMSALTYHISIFISVPLICNLNKSCILLVECYTINVMLVSYILWLLFM